MAMKVSGLRRKAVESGVAPTEVDRAFETERPKLALVDLLLRHQPAGGVTQPAPAPLTGARRKLF